MPVRRVVGSLAAMGLALGVICALIGSGAGSSLAAAAVPASYSIWPGSTVPKIAADSDTSQVEVGTRFRVDQSGEITDLRFYQAAPNVGPHVGTLWSSSGDVLAKVTFANTTGTGWQQAKLTLPVSVVAGRQYVVSYHAPHGRYADDPDVFSDGATVDSYALTALAGVYSYDGQFPTRTWRDSSYYVDVVFRPAVSSPTSVPTSSSPPAPSPTQSGPGTRQANCAPKPSSCGYPDATNTGVPAGVTLKKSGSVTASTNGQVIDGLDITGEINVTASNVVIKNTRVTGGKGVGPADWVVILRPGADNLTIQDSEITTPAGSPQDIACVFNIGNGAPKVIRTDISNCSAGVSSGAGNVRDSYIHDMSQVAGLSHDVGIASNGGGGMTITHNTIFNQLGQTATIAFYQDFGTQSNDLVQDNLLAGGGYCMYGGAGGKGATSNIKFLNNRLSNKYFPNCGYWGILASFTSSDPGNQFSGNYWDSTLRPAN